ncbi:MAG: SDR family oxidoreductase [Betaproteobacteria bacterium]|nr:SDR family oxidoreductase [Betaproteobacteria bacterium]
MGLLDGKVAIITGGSRGIGRASAELFAREGATLALCARTQAKLEQAADELSPKYNVKVFTQAVDITDVTAVEKFAAAVGREFGKVHVLVNNAGESSQRVDGVRTQVNSVDTVAQALPGGRFEKITDDEWRNVFERKILGMIRVTRAFLPLMRGTGGGSIVNVTSTKAKQPPPRVVTSGVAWAAATNWSKSLSHELAGDNIRVNVVSVDSIYSDQIEINHKHWAPQMPLAEFLAPHVANVPLKRFGTAEEAAQAILFLAAPISSYITGQFLAVDGGGLRGI